MVGYHMDNDGIGIVLILRINNEEYWLDIIWIMVGYHMDNDGIGISLRYVKNFDIHLVMKVRRACAILGIPQWGPYTCFSVEKCKFVYYERSGGAAINTGQ